MPEITWCALASIGVGATFGAWSRWLLGSAMNHWLPHLPFGTLVANLAGGYLIGVAVALFRVLPGVAPEWRLALVTGFLGALTTFSTFSAESVHLLETGQYGWALAHAGSHLVGSIVLTALGIMTVRAFT